MRDYLIFMTYIRHFSAKSTLSHRVVSSVYRWWDHCAMPPVSPAIIDLAGVALVQWTMFIQIIRKTLNNISL